MTGSQTLPPPQGPEYARCVPCGHIEPEHRPDAGPCLVCDCAAYRPAAVPSDEDFLVAVEGALESVLLPEPGIAVLERTRDAVTGALAPLVADLRRMAGEAQQPTPCDQPNACDPDTGELCATHEEEQAHAEGEHEYCGVTCGVQFPSEEMRNFVVAKGYPGTAGMLDELLRRAATGQLPAVGAQQPETQPRRGDPFEAWLKEQRDAAADYPEAHQAADGLLDLYRLHADTGTPLGEHVCEGRVAGDCECLETADGARQAEAGAPPVCGGFQWIGQSFATCDRCGQPAWEHDGEEVAVDGAGPFDTRRTVRPWKPGEADAIRAKWGTPATAVARQADTAGEQQ